jgi:DNA ligase 1
MLITKPMLAAACEESDFHLIKYPVLGTPKLDGIRCLKIDDGQVVSRTFKPIQNKYIRERLNKELPIGADGEIISGATFQECTHNVMSFEGEPEFLYYMFDYVATDPRASYQSRVRDYLRWHEKKERPLIIPLKPKVINNNEELLAFEEKMLALGHEGICIRTPDGPYKNGRSTLREGYLLKIKRFKDSEAVIVGFEELYSNQNEAEKDAFGRTKRSTHKDNLVPQNILGAFIVTDKGQTFKIGTGITAEQRKDFWFTKDQLLNKIIRYKYFEVGVKDAPRHPVFDSFRDPSDIGE